MSMYEFDASGAASIIDARHEVVLFVPEGWFPTGHGIASSLEPPIEASVGWWTIARVHLDPCRWRSSPMADPWQMRDPDLLARALSESWLDPTQGGGGFAPADDMPRATRPVMLPWQGRRTPYLELAIPEGIDLAACDGGEYRLWEDPEGVSRLGQAGALIRIRIVDFEPGIAVIEYSSIPGAWPSTVAGLMQSGPDVAIFRFPSSP
jgi:hypothetical protein